MLSIAAAGLASLRELTLDGNSITSLSPIVGLTCLEVLLVAHNQLKTCAGVEVNLLGVVQLVDCWHPVRPHV